MTTAIIGGSGFGELADFKSIEERMVATPFGSPSTVILQGELAGQPLYFLATKLAFRCGFNPQEKVPSYFIRVWPGGQGHHVVYTGLLK